MKGQQCDQCGAFIPHSEHHVHATFARVNSPKHGSPVISYDFCISCLRKGIIFTGTKKRYRDLFDWASEKVENDGDPNE